MEIRKYGRNEELVAIPDLTQLQIKSYEEFLQADVPSSDRADSGLEAVIREAFPIEAFDKTAKLVYLGYELTKPKFTEAESRLLKRTYAMGLKIRVRLEKEEPIEEDVYLGDVPVMLGGGEFIVNGSERVIVSQLHRSPGVDFKVEVQPGEKKLHQAWIIPERGSWIEVNVTKKDLLQVKIDQSGKFLATTIIRAFDPERSSDTDIIKLFYKTEKVKLTGKAAFERIRNAYVATPIRDIDADETIINAGDQLTDEYLTLLAASGLKEIEIIEGQPKDLLLFNTLREDTAKTYDDALIRIYQKFRPGNPPSLEKARQLFDEKFRDKSRYRLGKVGRFRLNRKFVDPVAGTPGKSRFGKSVADDEMTLTSDDFVNVIKYILALRSSEPGFEVDDIDHLGNRRVRTIAELAAEEIRKGFLKLRKTAQEKLNMEKEGLSPRQIINAKTISSSIDYFFGRGELSQVVDQTNPLSQLTHERRLSALGPSGLNRKRASFEVRDVHISHYGRICPIETPEGANIGLIASLGIYAGVDRYGFLTTPYRIVRKGKVTDEVKWLRADEETREIIAPADTPRDKTGRLDTERVMARRYGDFKLVPRDDVSLLDVSPMQIVGVSASLIPFLEHDDANRALMGSNMQRQAVPLIRSEPPVVATGMERFVASNSGLVVTARNAGVVKSVSATEIAVGDDVYQLRKFTGLNERTCQNQRPIVKEGDKVARGQVIADGAATHQGELSLGKNIFVAFMTWDGYNFEDAVLVSEELIRNDVFTSIHIEDYEATIKEPKVGKEEFTRDIPNVSERILKNLAEDGVVRVGTRVGPGDILVGKIAPKSKNELSPEEKLLHAIFGRAGEDVKNDSLELGSGTEGVVISTERLSRKVNHNEEERQKASMEIVRLGKQHLTLWSEQLTQLLASVKELRGEDLTHKGTKRVIEIPANPDVPSLRMAQDAIKQALDAVKDAAERKRALEIQKKYVTRIEDFDAEKQKRINRLSRGDDLPTGVQEMVKVYLATKRRLSVGDKIAGRHGNKGVIARILPIEDMPHLADGTPVQMLLNPLGVPSRMNVGQILEVHLGWAMRTLGTQAVTPVFEGAKEADINVALREAGLPEEGKVTLFDGRTGEPYEQKITVGFMYILKLHHLVDEKIHARATGPYSLITQQPLGGKARYGGQRFGEMEVWALEAYGAAYVLQELLTVKSDDVDGRTKIYESMVKGENTLEAGTPVSFDVLCNEIKGLCLNIELIRQDAASAALLG